MAINTAVLKRLVVEALLQTEPYFLVIVDATHPQARVPPELRQQTVGLHIGFDMPGIQMQGFLIDEVGISATLTFGRQPYPCYAPWDAILGVDDQQPNDPPLMIWPAKDANGTARVVTGPQKRVPKGKPKLQLVVGGGGDNDGSGEPSEPA